MLELYPSDISAIARPWILSFWMSVLGSRVAIMQAPLGRAGGTQLAVAVSRAGGLGTLGASYMAPEDLREQIRSLRDQTGSPFCVNLILDYDQQSRIDVLEDEGVPSVSFSWGIDPIFISRALAWGARVLVQVVSVSAARQAVEAGADGLIVQGVEAGGHVQGTVELIPLLMEIRAAVSVPLVAAGGISDLDAVRGALTSGADAIAMGTRFVASEESLAHARYKERLIEATGADTVLTQLFDSGTPPWRAPHRVIRNHVYDRWESSGCPPSGQRPAEDEPVATAPLGSVPRYAVIPPVVGMHGDVEAMAMYAGQGVGAITSIEPAGTIVERFAAALRTTP